MQRNADNATQPSVWYRSILEVHTDCLDAMTLTYYRLSYKRRIDTSLDFLFTNTLKAPGIASETIPGDGNRTNVS